jgi:hypothetical protein
MQMGIELKRPIERLAYRRPEAAAALGVSESKFLDWERRGIMPRPIHVDGCRLYDAEQIRIAWEALKDGSEPPAFDNSNPYDLA